MSVVIKKQTAECKTPESLPSPIHFVHFDRKLGGITISPVTSRPAMRDALLESTKILVKKTWWRIGDSNP